MGLGLTAATVVVLLLPSFTSFAAIFILIALFNIFMSPIGSLSDSATISMLGEQRAMYGRIRLGGTLGWGLFAPIAGALVLKYGLNIAFWVFAGIMFLNLLVSQKFSFGKPEEHASDHGGIRALLTNRRWVIFFTFFVSWWCWSVFCRIVFVSIHVGTGCRFTPDGRCPYDSYAD